VIGDGPLVEVYINGQPYHRVTLSERLWKPARFPDSGRMPPVNLLHVPEDGAPFRVLVRPGVSGDSHVDLGDHEVHPVVFDNPYPHLYAYPWIALRLCQRVTPPSHSASLADVDFEQGSLW
jgi:hypothetical protein